MSRVLMSVCGLTCSIALAACSGVDVPVAPDQMCPATSLVAPEPCDLNEPVAPRSKMATNDLPQNSLSAATLSSNWPLLSHLKLSALSSVTFTVGDPLLARKEADELLKYVASCALDPCDAITIPANAGPSEFPTSFPGELGLCGQRYLDSLGLEPVEKPQITSTSTTKRIPTETLWKNAKATQGCLERVSACMLARVNSARKKVTISLRGKGLETLDRVPTATMFRENRGTPILSFKSCDTPCLWGDFLRRNCDWEPRHVGQCNQGDQIGLKLPSGTHGRIRVCKGLHGCDDTEVAAPGAGWNTLGWTPILTLPDLPAYGGEMLAQDFDEVLFTCPDNGLDRTGYYAVMLAAPVPGAAPLDKDLNVEVSDLPLLAHDYPATEENVFTYREGAFYGDLFKPITIAPNSCPGTDMFSGEQYVCVSRMWSEGAAMASDRFCAVPGMDCFTNPVTGCDNLLAPPKIKLGTTTTSPTPPWATTSVAKDLSIAEKDREVYDMCEGPGRKFWHHPYTTYLNHPCDLFPSLDACKPFLTADVCHEVFGIDHCKGIGN